MDEYYITLFWLGDFLCNKMFSSFCFLYLNSLNVKEKLRLTPNQRNLAFLFFFLACFKSSAEILSPSLIRFLGWDFFFFILFPGVTSVDGPSLQLSHTHWHAHQRHYKKTRRLLSMQHKCAQHKWDHFFFSLLFVFKKKLRNKCFRFEEGRKKNYTWWNTFHQTNRERRRRRRKKKRFFFTLSSQC